MQHRLFPQVMFRNRTMRRLRTIIHALTVAALLAGLIPLPVITGMSGNVVSAADLEAPSLQIVPAPITGTVYRDFNNDGQRAISGMTIDTGVADVTVTAYGDTGSACGSVMTTSTGAFSLTPACNGPWRIEFTDLPPNYRPTRSGAQNNTTVQFVNSAPMSNIDLGILEPCLYCQDNPKIAVVNHQRNEDPPATSIAIEDFDNSTGAVFTPSDTVDNDWDWGRPNATPPLPTTRNVATAGDIGTTMGLVWDRSNTRLLAGAYFRGFTALKANSSANGWAEAAIYQIPYTNGTPSTPSLWLDLETLFGDDFAGTFVPDRNHIAGNNRTNDNPNLIGYTGLGGLALATDYRELYAVNLDSLEVLVIPIDSSGAAPLTSSSIKRFPFPADGCPSGSWSYGRSYRAAFGVAVYPPTGEVYATLTCTGPTLADMQGLVYSFDPTDTTPSATDMTLRVSIPMNIQRPTVNNSSGWYTNDSHEWYELSSFTYEFASVSKHTMPWLGEPLFTVRADGGYDLTIAERNRFHDTNASAYYVAAGVMYKACSGGSATAPSWTLEENGVCGPNTSTVNWTFSAGGRAGSNTDANNRFYRYVGAEGSMMQGTIAYIPGSEIVAAGLDAVRNSADHGIAWFDPNTGDRSRTALYNANVLFTKANNQGDIEVLCDPAPIEIGNRVWEDSNGDGTQDPGEAPIQGVTVTLHDGSGNQIASAVTDANGNYYFSNGPGTDTSSVIYNLAALTPNTTGFEVRIDTTQSAVSSFSLSPANADAEQRDSDALLDGSTAKVVFDTGIFGANDHTYDFGFTNAQVSAVGSIEVTKQIAAGSDSSGVANWEFTITSDTVGCLLSAPYDATPAQTTATGADGQVVTFNNLRVDDGNSNPCTYTIIETNLPMGWQTTSTNPQTGLTVSDGGTTQISFTNEEIPVASPAALRIVKEVSGGNVSAPFTVTVTGPNSYNTTVSVTPGTPTDLTNLEAGQYTVVESGLANPPVGFTWSGTGYTPTNGQITLVAGGSGLVTITNQLAAVPPDPATLIINKVVSGGTASGSFTMTVTGPNSFNQRIVVTPGTPTILNNLSAGTYTVVESERPAAPTGFAWQAAVYEPSNGQLTLAVGETGEVTVTNPLVELPVQFGDRIWIEADGDGIANNGVITPVVGIVITATNGITIYTTTTDAAGYYSFTVPADTYTVTYGSVPAMYGLLVPSTVVSGTSESGNTGIYQESGDPDANHGQNTIVTLAAGEANWQVDFAFTAAPRFDLALIKTLAAGQPGIVQPGDLVTFTLTVYNQGTIDAYDIDLVDYIPADMTLAAPSGSPDWTDHGITATLTIDQLNAAQSTVVDIMLQISANFTGTTITNWAEIADASASIGGSTAFDVDSTPDTQNGNTAGEDANSVNDASSGNGQNGGDEDDHDPAVISIAQPPGTLIVRKVVPVITNCAGIVASQSGDPITIDNSSCVDILLATPDYATVQFDFTDDVVTSGGVLMPTFGLHVGEAMTFTNVIPGLYSVEEVLPVGWELTAATCSNGDNPTAVTVGSNLRVTCIFTNTPTLTPRIDLEKSTNGEDADLPTGPMLAVGDTVTWTYEITNTGNVTLTDITLVDNREGDITASCPITTLIPGEGTNCIVTGVATAGQYSNTAIVTGTPTITGTVAVTDADPSHYIVLSLAQIGDRVWIESDSDGLASTGDITPVAGMVIIATDGTEVYTTTTDADGYYSFTVPGGTYEVTYGTVPAIYGAVEPSSMPGGNNESGDAGQYQESGDPDRSHANGTVVMVAAGEANWHVDFAFTPLPAQFGDRVLIEDDGDGLAATGVITPVAGLVITATNGTDVYTATTNADGYYSFTVAADTYTVTYGTVPAQYGDVVPSAVISGTESGNAGAYAETGDLDANHAQNTTVTLAGGEANWQVDFVFTPLPDVITYSLGNRLWIDDGAGDLTNRDNGLYDAGELPVADGVVVELLNITGTVIATTTTDLAGYYRFDGLAAGDYQVRIPAEEFQTGGLLTGLASSTGLTTTFTTGENNLDHGDDDTSDGVTSAVITLTANNPTGEVDTAVVGAGANGTTGDANDNLTVDFGFVPPLAQFGDRVWIESDADGNANTGDIRPVEGMVITATDGSNVYTTATNALGYYSFTVPGTLTGQAYTVTYGDLPAVYGAVEPSATPGGSSESGDAGSYAEGGNPDASHANGTTVYVEAGEANWQVDFAFTPLPVQFGDRVLIEDDGDGLAATGVITPVAGLVITATNGTDVYTATTNADGYYSFTVAADTYTVTYGTVPAQYGDVVPSAVISGTESGNAGAYAETGDLDANHGQNTTVALAGGEANWNIDFVFTPLPDVITYSLGNRLWIDDGAGNLANRDNGIYDDGELPVADGVVVELLNITGTVVATTTTDLAGYYRFDGLAAGDYQVRIPAEEFQTGGLLTGLASSSGITDTFTSGENNFDHGDDETSDGVTSAVIMLGANNPTGEADGGVIGAGANGTTGDANDNLTVDFGFVPPLVLLGDRLWVEDDNDGDATTGNVTPVTGQVVTATSSGGMVYTDTTNANGLYTITMPANDTYTVTTGLPANVVDTPILATDGSDPVGNNDRNHERLGTTVVMTTTDNLSIDFGFYQAAQFGDRVWIESDTDGLASTGTIIPVAGMVITATDGTNTYTTATNAQGYYSFTVPGGTYEVTYGTVPATYGAVEPSGTPGGNSESGDAGIYAESGDPDRSHENGTVVTVAAGEANWLIDFAFTPVIVVQPAQFGDRVWIESDNDGLASSGDITPVAGMVITATDGMDVYTTTTDADGYYSFTVPADTYTVTYGTMPAVYGAVEPSGTPGGNSESGDAGVYQESGDPDRSHANGTTVTVAGGEANWTIDFAFNPLPAQFGDRVLIEDDGDGIAATGIITPVAGMIITATDGANTYTTTTNTQGYYSFTVPGGSYAVTYGDVPAAYGAVVPSTVISTTESGNAGLYGEGGEPDQNHGQGTEVTLVAGEANWQVDFVFTPLPDVITYSLGNRLWIDDGAGDLANRDNGLYDVGELPVAEGVIVELYTITGTLVSTTTTDAAGYYRFDGLAAGDYYVEIPAAEFQAGGLLAAMASSTGITATFTTVENNVDHGDDDTSDGVTSAIVTVGANNPTGEVDGGTVGAGANGTTGDANDNLTVDFGFVPPLAQFGDRVFIESDADGLASSGDITAVAGMIITATDGTTVYTTTTNALGYYSFTVPGGVTYTVTYGAVPASYGAVEPSATPGGSSEAGDAGSYAAGGDPDASHANSTTVRVEAGEANWQVDFAFTPLPVQFGDRVLIEDDGDGLAGTGVITPVEGLVITATNGTTVYTTTTDADGYYSFTVSADIYTVTYGTVPAQYGDVVPSAVLSAAESGNAGAYQEAGNPDANHAQNTTVTLAGGEANWQVDFVFTPLPDVITYSLGNRLWIDDGAGDPANRDNGLYDAGEQPVAEGVVVELLNITGTVIATTTTDLAGYYRFDRLAAGDYQVRIPADEFQTGGLLTGLSSSTGLTTTFTTRENNLDHGDDDTSDGVTSAVITLGANNPTGEVDVAVVGAGANGTTGDANDNLTVDFGFVPPLAQPAQFGDRVWIESDGDGLAATGDITPVAGMVITATDGTTIYTTATNAEGYYSFTVPGGVTYTVTYGDVPVSYGAVEASATPGGSSESGAAGSYAEGGNPDASHINGSTVYVAPGDANWQVDFAFTPLLGAIGNYVWVDENSDGYQDAGEPGIPNVRVVLYDDAGNQIAETRTDSSGHYLFPDLPLGDYFVDIDESTIPDGMTQTPPSTLPGADFGNQDQSADPTNGDHGYPATIMPDAPENLTADFGYNYNPSTDVDGGEKLVALGDRIWIDSDGNGAQDPEEVGVAGVELTLYSDPDGDGIYDTVVATDTTDVNGFYLFDELEPGAYVVAVTDSGNASHDVLDPASYDQTGDPDHFGQPENTATPGTANDNLSTVPVVLGPGDVYLNVDFGYQPQPATPLGSIGDTIWFDADADGNGPAMPPVDGGADVNQGLGTEGDAVDYGIPGVTVALIQDVNGDGIWQPATEPLVATDVTDANGQYLFTGLPLTDGNGDSDADYIVWVNDTENVLADLRPTYDYDDGTSAPNDLSARAISTTEPDVRDQDFGYTPNEQTSALGLIGDTVWLDVDGGGGDQGTQGDEPGIEGVVMELLDNNGAVIATTTTDENGHYYFGGLPLDETYQVQVAPENFQPSGVLEGLSNTFDPNSGNDSVGPTVTLTAANPIDLDQDFSYVYVPLVGELIGRIGNLVWLDPNANGVYEPALGESPIGGVTVDLYRDLNGNATLDPSEPRLASTVTVDTIDATVYGTDGNYLFTGLPAGDYIVDVTDDADILAGYWHSLGTMATDNNSQLDPYAVRIGNGDPMEDLTADFGYYVDPAAVGNYVWLDENHDGVQNDGETGINGVTVVMTITYPNGVETVLTTVTAADSSDGNPGWYSFGNLLIDEDYNGDSVGDEPTFVIAVDTEQAALTGYEPTAVDEGNDDTVDSDEHRGVNAQPVQGQLDTSRANDDATIASYDFGFIRVFDLALRKVLASSTMLPVMAGDEITFTLVISNQGTVDAYAIEVSDALPTGLSLGGNDMNSWNGTGNVVTHTVDFLPAGGETTVDIMLTIDANFQGTSLTNVAEISSADDDTNPNNTPPSDIDSTPDDNPYNENDVKDNVTDEDGTVPGEDEDDHDLETILVQLPASLGDLVWEDLDHDGIQDVGEPGITGVTVTLTLTTPAGVLLTTTTDASGNYTFTNLVPGMPYRVTFATPDGYTSTTSNVGDDATDSDGPVVVVTLQPGEHNPTIDSGFWRPLSLGNQLWEDLNNNGAVDAGEPGVVGVTMHLYRDSNNDGQPEGAAIATMPTGADGLYLFTGLISDTYIVELVAPVGYVSSTPDAGDADVDVDDNDDNGLGSNGGVIRSTPVTLAYGDEPTGENPDNDPTTPDVDENLTVDFGIWRPASLGDHVWEDLDHDGIQDPNEPGIAGVTVTLTTPAGLVLTTTTDVSGNYTFTELLSGMPYTVTFAIPDEYRPTTSNVGDDATDSDGAVVVVTLQPGEHNPKLDSGFWRPAGIGDRVWYDDNRNGLQDGAEAGVVGVTVELRNSAGQVIGTTTTNASGYYSFTNLPTGDYSMRFVPNTLPHDYLFTESGLGGDVERDSDADATTGETVLTNLQPGEYDPTWDAGILLPLVNLGDFVWIDGDRDGQQDAGEPGVPALLVTLEVADGQMLTTPTDLTGHYTFTNLLANQQVTVLITLPDGYSVTTPNNGDDALDSDPDSTGIVIVNLGTTDDYTIDAGLIVDPVVVGDHTFIDLNRNGVQDNGDQPLPGVVLHLTKADGSPATDVFGNPVLDQTTDGNGNYRFANLPPGEYTVSVVSVPSGYVPTAAHVGTPDRDSSTGSATSSPTTGTAVQPDGEDLTLDFGFVPMVNLGNLVWLDSNNNGQVDAGEPGIPGITVQLFRAGDDPTTASPLRTEATDANGNYRFENLEPGRYFVYIPVPPAAYPMSSTPTDSADNGEDNDDNGSQGAPGAPVTSPVIELAVIGEPVNDGDGENGDLTIDFSFIPLLDLGDLVWHDVNVNGQVDAGEEGVRNVTVQLFRAGDDPATATPLQTDVTDAHGNYRFENLEPGGYFVYIPTPPRQYPVSTMPTDGNNNGENNDDNGAQMQRGQPVRSPIVDLQVGTEPRADGDDDNGDLTVDFGFFELASLGDLVWFDLDQDGVQDAQETGEPGTLDERGVPSVVVTLYDAVTNRVVATTTTDTHGHYLFGDLLPGSYYVGFEVPAGYILTTEDRGANDAFDSDVNPTTFHTPPTTLESEEHDPTLDMGLYLPTGTVPAAIGDWVWFDTDRDGLQDEAELGVPGVTVILRRSDGSIVAVTTTAMDGAYQFNSLPPGDYYVEFVPPAGYGLSPQDVGTDDGSDSDADPATGRTIVTTLEAGEYDPSWDLGLTLDTPPASIGDMVWYDADADGLQDEGEMGVPGVVVTLYRADGAIVATTRTDADGHYEFINLPPGDYFLEFTPRRGYVSTLPNQGDDDSADSDVDVATRRTVVTTLAPGENDLTWDYGLFMINTRSGELQLPAEIGNRVWEDTNQNGLQDNPADEPSIPDVTVKLYDGDGQLIAIDVTDENGEYLFPNLIPGEYYIEFVLPDGYTITIEGTDPTSDLDSNVDPNTGRTLIELLEPGEANPTLDAGLVLVPTNLGDEDEPQQTMPHSIYLPVITR